MDRRRWHAERGLLAKVAAENKQRINTETMLRFIAHEGIIKFQHFFVHNLDCSVDCCP